MESADGETARRELQQEMGSTTCCACPVCTCGVNCACPKGEGAGCDPCAAFMKEAASFATATKEPLDPPHEKEASAVDRGQSEEGSTTCCACPVCTCGPSCACPKGEGAGCDPCAAFMKQAASSATAAAAPADQSPRQEANVGSAGNEMKGVAITDDPNTGCCSNGTSSSTAATSSSAAAAAAASAASLTPEEQKAVRKERRDRAREAKLTQTKIRDKSTHRQRSNGGGGGGGGGGNSKKRWGAGRRGKGKSKGNGAGAGGAKGGAEREDKVPDVFDQWLGVKLTAWKEAGETATHGGGDGAALATPPEESGVKEEIDFDPSKDEIAFPACLSALQRRQVHGWAMQLALFHASSGEDQERHVIVSKTGVFQGKVLTRGGRTWYKKGVTAPVVERFALKPGHEEIAAAIVAAMHSFHKSVQLREPGFEEWLNTYALPAGGSDPEGSEMEKAQEAFLKWPLLDEVEVEYVDTPEKLSALAEALASCGEFAFDLEAHNARTYHGLSCLLQISTQSKDYIVDPLADGMWDSMPLLRSAFGEPGVLKIGHSIRSLDVPSLYRDFGIVVVNAIDTEEAVHALGEKHSGLGKVLVNAGVRETHDVSGLKQAMQACDWRERPLSPDKLMYARCDTHYLIPLWHLLRARLLAADTFSNREDAREAEELREIKRGLDADQQRKEEAARQRRLPPSALSMDGVGSGLLSLKGSAALSVQKAGSSSPARVSPGKMGLRGADSPAKSPSRSGANSPARLAQEPWTSEWDDPEDCHKRERSRSGSIYRPDLESIYESKNAAGLESALAAAFQEEDDEDEDAGRGVGAGEEIPLANASGSSHHHGGLGRNFTHGDSNDDEQVGGEEGAPEQEEEGPALVGGDDEDDEDEDLWEGWGEAVVASVLGDDNDNDNDATALLDGDAQSLAGEEEEAYGTAVAAVPAAAAPLPTSVPTVVPPPPRPASSASHGVPSLLADPVASTPASGGTVEEGGGGTRSASPPPEPAATPATSKDASGGAVVANEPSTVVLTDGVRLVWKAVSRTQVATAVLWRPAPEAKREDSHNERHFRTAVQRLTPPRWTEVNVRVYEDIYLWRDRTARRMDDGAAYVCPGDILIDVALAMPRTLDALRRVSAPLSPVLGHADTPEAAELVRVVRVALGLPAEEQEGEGESAGRISEGTAPRNLDGAGDCAGVGVISPNPVLALAVAAAAGLLGLAFAFTKRSSI
ncbi:unnamed protein product [Scytosiphon promiscuus]